ncbi:trichoplein keratin filament-binding protein-like [Penaeus indicus]|uniref:trichoplein keratin filament-binding protein-like n=1 Tax=Penaeus indicus TaxID=29960 RepID=UPI00300D489C
MAPPYGCDVVPCARNTMSASNTKKKSNATCIIFLFTLLCIAGLVIALLSSAYSDALRRARKAEDDARTSWQRAETEWRKKESESIKAAEKKASAYHQQVKQTQEKVIRAQKATEGFEKRILKAEKEAALAKKDSQDFQDKLSDTLTEIVRMTKESERLQEKLNKAQKEAEEARQNAKMLGQLVKTCAVVTSEKPEVLTENYNVRREPTKKESVTGLVELPKPLLPRSPPRNEETT